jgi:2,4-dienoyl-CoA reductase-like NADH-dependent reductase (Old Yellow Enzyme family)
MENIPESQMSEVIEQARKKVYETQALVVRLSNEAVGGNVWKDREVKTVGEIFQKLQLLQMILLGQTTGKNFGLQK